MRDRLDLVVPLDAVTATRDAVSVEASDSVAGRVAAAAAMQDERQHMSNAELPPTWLDERTGFPPRTRSQLERRARQLRLSMRRIHRAARVARTIADLAGSVLVSEEHLDEALAHRPPEGAA